MTNIIKKSTRGYDVLPIESQLLLDREMFLTEEINAQTADALMKQLIYLDRESNEEITLYINSPGGCVYSGLAVYDCMNLIESPVRTVCIGTAASMAALLFLAGNKRCMMKHSQIMVHGPSYANRSMAGRKVNELQAEIDALSKMNDETARIISERTGIPLEEVLKIISQDTYYNAEEAVKSGIADEILTHLHK